MTSIKIDLSKRIKNYSLFEDTVRNNVEKIPHRESNYCDRALAQYYVSQEFLNDIDCDIPTAEMTNLFEFKEINGNSNTRNLIQFLLQAYPNHSIVPSGWWHYPVNGFMSWHTNSDIPSRRLYVTYADEDKKSFFRYEDENGQIITDYDNKGITIREFDNRDRLFWHCVYSECNRYSFGFRIQDMA
jgi:hypothetical protein